MITDENVDLGVGTKLVTVTRVVNVDNVVNGRSGRGNGGGKRSTVNVVVGTAASIPCIVGNQT
jgi:hypothetical protein